MNFDDYQEAASELAKYPGQQTIMGVFYCALGCAGEAGEVAEQVKKCWRDDSGDYATSIMPSSIITYDRVDKIKSELGDNLWYISQLAAELDLSLSEIAEGNISKLKSRKRRNMISGEGSDR